MAVTKYIGKIHYRCNMCGDTEYNDKYEWVGDITKTKLNICHKCGRRESGGKTWQQKSQQIKKLSQKSKL